MWGIRKDGPTQNGKGPKHISVYCVMQKNDTEEI